jgi:hypothetical protein
MFAINIEPSEDTAVLPMFKNGKYSYPALRVPEPGWAGEMYDIHGAPQYMLIDGSGRLVLKLDFDTAIPGHGNDPLTKADVQAFQKKIDLIGKKAIELRKKGVAKDMIRAQIQAEVPEMAPWTMNGLVNDMRLDAFYNELTAAAK